jgi:hypothetical protein
MIAYFTFSFILIFLKHAGSFTRQFLSSDDIVVLDALNHRKKETVIVDWHILSIGNYCLPYSMV